MESVMTRETKIGLLVGLLFIVAFGLVLSGIMPKEPPSAISPEMRTQIAGTPVATRPLTVPPPGVGDGWPVSSVAPVDGMPGGADAMAGVPAGNGMLGSVVSTVVGPGQTVGPGETTVAQVPPAGPVTPPSSSAPPEHVSPSGGRTITFTYDTPADVLRELRDRASDILPPAGTSNERSPVQPVAVTPPVPPSAATGQKHIVKQGDTLFALAKRYYGENNGAQHTRIFEANKSIISSPQSLPIGVELVIPPPVAASPPAPAQPTRPTVVPSRVPDTEIVVRTPTMPPSLVVVEPPSPAKTTHTVKPGDTLSAIARENGKTIAELAKINGLENPNNLRVGLQLKLAN